MTRFMRVGQVARELGCSVDTIRRYVEEERIPCFRTPGGQLQFRTDDVEAFQNATDPKPIRPERPETAEESDHGRLRPKQRRPSWEDLAPWEQRRAEVAAELEIEEMYGERAAREAEQERAHELEAERRSEEQRLMDLKKLGRMWCWNSRAMPHAIKELERFVTAEQIPKDLPIWEQQSLVRDFVSDIEKKFK